MAMPQCPDAYDPAASKRANPTIDTAGAMVKGVMNLSIKPMMPKYPMTSWNNEATIIAPWICRILICHTSVFSSSVIVSKSVGHSFSGKDNMAIVGTRNENVPP